MGALRSPRLLSTTITMETSSHALHQRRVEGLVFTAAVFTNLTRDHLDYHGTMEQYFAAKAMLVGQLAPDGLAVVNADDRAWDSLPSAPRTVRFGLDFPFALAGFLAAAFFPVDFAAACLPDLFLPPPEKILSHPSENFFVDPTRVMLIPSAPS